MNFITYKRNVCQVKKMDTVLVTGSFGNIGTCIVKTLLEHKYQVVAYDLKTPRTESVSKQFKSSITTYWGDITDTKSIQDVLKEDIDAVIHLAFVIPPLTEKNPDIAEKVNIKGTKNLIYALTQDTFQGPVVFTSSVSVFGITQHEPPPVTRDHHVIATDMYTAHKIECESMFKKSMLDWRILRYSAVLTRPDLSNKDQLSHVFQIPVTTRVEPVHVKDAAFATVNALKKASKKVFIIAGGPKAQTLWGTFLVKTLEPYIGAVSPDALPAEKFLKTPYYLDWYDTTDSQKILHYQNHTLEDYIQDIYADLGMKRVFFKFLRPLIKWKIFH
jgi:nucleoside-diphosphate-sugar epimerase